MSKKALGKGLGAIFKDDPDLAGRYREEGKEENSEKKREDVNNADEETIKAGGQESAKKIVKKSLPDINSSDENKEPAGNKDINSGERDMSRQEVKSDLPGKVENKNGDNEDEFAWRPAPVEEETIKAGFFNNLSGEQKTGEIKVKLSLIEPTGNQPRKNFDEESLNELAESIKRYGVLQPLLVKKNGDMYEIIAGERRWRAAKLAGLREIPVIIKEIEKSEAAEIAIIENIQREDLDSIEEARAYRSLIEEYGLTQEEVADRVAKSRSAVTNSLRLLNLDERVQEMLTDGSLTQGHARTLITISDKDRQYELACMIRERGLSVRETEKFVKNAEKKAKDTDKKDEKRQETEELRIYLDDAATRLTERLGTKVLIKPSSKQKGKIQIDYYSPEDLEKIIKLLS